MINRKKCDICGHSELRQIFDLGEYNVIECMDCGTRSRDVIYDAEEIDKLYSKDYFCDLQKDFFFDNLELRIKAFKRKLRELDKVYPRKGTMLDIGCATGTFMKVAKEDGWDVKGIEISKFASEYAKNNEKLEVMNCDLTDAGFEDSSFDVVTMWDLIDHCESPAATMREVCRILKPGGLAAMDTFMEDGLLFALANLSYRLSLGAFKFAALKAHPMHHSHYFSTNTFRALAEKNGLEVIFQEGSFLEADIISLGAFGKNVVNIVNALSQHIGKKMESMIIAKKGAER